MKTNIKVIIGLLALQLFAVEAYSQGFKLPWDSGKNHYVSRTGTPSPTGAIGTTCGGPNSAYNGFNAHPYVAIDFDTPNGIYDAVRASKAGKIEFAGISGSLTTGYGRLVRIKHSDNTQTYYAHNNQLFVVKNQSVQQGCVIADGGNTGHSFGDHIHFEWRDVGGVAFSDKRYATFSECGCKVKPKYCYKSTNANGACAGAPCAPPINDNCSAATLLTSNGAQLNGTVKCATGSLGANQCTGCNCTSPDDLDVYYKFVAQATTHTVTISNYASNFDGVIELRSGCGAGTNLGCYDPSGSPAMVSKAFTGLNIGQTYYVRVFEWDNAGTPPSSPTFSVKVTHSCNKPANIPTISGSSTACSNTAKTFSVTPVSGATSYTWTLPSGWTGTSTTSSITATVGTSSGDVKVKANNGCGSSDLQTKQVTVTRFPVMPGAIVGSAATCANSSQTYSVPAVAGATSYTWTMPAGWTGSSTTPSITATAGNNSGAITVKSINSCGSSAAQTKQVSVSTTTVSLGAISGSATACKNSPQAYSVTPVAGATSYTWTLPSGWIGSSTSAAMNATPGAASGPVTVTANTGCGSSAPKSLQVNVVNLNNTVTVNSSVLTTSATGVNYQWINCSTMQPISGATGQVYNAPQNGNYAVIVTKNNCVDTSACHQITALGLTFIDNSIKLVAYPNPTSNQIRLTATGLTNETHRVVFTNSKGQILIDKDVDVDNQAIDRQFDISKFANGMYFMTISSKNFNHVFKIEKL